MKQFSQFNIETPVNGFEGDKIKMSKILNREIEVHHYKIEDSKVFNQRGTGKCLHLQISLNGQKHVVFTASSGLMNAIRLVPEDGFPFATTIIEDNERFLFS